MEPNGQEVTFTLRGAVTVHGTVLMPDGSPAAHVQIFALQGTEPIAVFVRSDSNGHFSLTVPPDGEGVLTVQGHTQHKTEQGFRRYRGYVQVNDLAERIQLRLKLAR